VWKTETLTLSEMGMATTLIETPDSAPTGTWSAEVLIPGESSSIASTRFMIEDFAPPRISVATSLDKKELFLGETSTLSIFSQYLFGAPADGLPYEIETSFIPREYSHPDWQGYHFSDNRKMSTSIASIEGSGELSQNGEAVFELPPIAYSNIWSMLDVNIRTGVMEDSGRWVYESLKIPYYPTKTLLGIKPPTGQISIGKSAPFAFAAINVDGKVSKIDKALLYVYKSVPRNIVTMVDGRRRIETRYELVVIDDYDGKALSFDEGLAEVKINFNHTGTYTVVLDDPESGATSALIIYASNSGWSYGYSDDDSATQKIGRAHV
jgi:uncharacterized protein YfaS (alpha-2-macroglobulin family)